MLPFFGTHFANASSVHLMGRKASEAVSAARRHVGKIIGSSSEEVYFTSGATESNNLVLLGLTDCSDKRRRILVSAIEHKSVLEPCRRLVELGYEVLEIPVTQAGVLDVGAAERLINKTTRLVSVQGANNEIGTLQPVRAIAEIAHANNALVHCDASQMVGKVPISVEDLKVDFASFSAHKVYGPKGVGALYKKRGIACSAIKPLIVGGGQEFEVRPGTLNVPGIVGFGEACRLALRLLDREMLRIAHLRNLLEERLLGNLSDTFVIGADAERLPGTSSIFFGQAPSDALIARTPLVCVGTGSACTSGALSPSHVLLACGYSRDAARCVIRISLGRYTTEQEVEFAATRLTQSVNAIREYGAHQRMHQHQLQVSER
jgi:cysteine desulfurase